MTKGLADIKIIPALQDNYIYILTASDGTVAIIDPAEAAPVIDYLEKAGKKPAYILNTHHHHDHTGGNQALKERYGCEIIGPAADEHRIPYLDTGVREGDTVNIGDSAAQIIETPGHTGGHICFWFKDDHVLLAGDTLFSMGCGRLFEGTAEQMWQSLSKLAALPDDTQIYCGHEYTAANGNFALTVEPDNADIKKRMDEVKALRAAGKPTLPVSLRTEKKTNPFLRAGSATRFAEIRKAKDAA